jgi:hypothetical protein
MPPSIDAVADTAPWRLQPVESTSTQRRAAEEEERAASAAQPAAAFRPREEPVAGVYTPPSDVVASVQRFTPDSVAPALAEALASEPWGHPMPQKFMWEQAPDASERSVRREEPAAAPVTVAAASASPPAPAASSAPAATPIATTAAAPATQAAVDAAGAAAPVATAWLTSLLKAR